MKNQYFGDINDYRKYGLLRCFAEAGLNIGVCWMLTPETRMQSPDWAVLVSSAPARVTTGTTLPSAWA